MDRNAPLLTVVIVSYNSASVLISCLGDFIDETEFEVIIVDNASEDGSAVALGQRFPNRKLIGLASNRGYGGAANCALRVVTSPYALLLNPDLTTTDGDIKSLLAVAHSHANAAIIAPATDEHKAANVLPVEKSWVLGAAMLFDMQAVKALNFFDENIFLYYEEKDICYRALQANYTILEVPSVYFPHMRGKSTPRSSEMTYLRQWHVAWSSAYYFTKHQLDKGKNAPRFMQWRYWLKARFSIDREERLKYLARFRGVSAFLRGEKAYIDGILPQGSVAKPAV